MIVRLTISVAATVLLLAAPAAAQSACERGDDILASLDARVIAGIEAEAAREPNGAGRLFRVERDGLAPSFLYGTMHLADPRVLALPSVVGEAFDASTSVVVESLDVSDDDALAALLLSRSDLLNLPAGTTLDELLPADRREEHERTLADFGVPLEAVRTLQPWFVALGLALTPCEAEAQERGDAVLDDDLLRRGEAAGKIVHGLESAEEQLEAIASLPLDLQGEMLASTIDLVPRMPDIVETMTLLYLRGEIAMITPAVEALAPAGTDDAASARAYRLFEAELVDRRNHRMAERLAPILDRGASFVAVGAAHLPGEEGLVELLREDGWTVSRAD